MRKQEFLKELGERLWGLPREEIQERLNFYSEMIDDRMEEGLPEDAAVAQLGPVEEIAAQILAEIPLRKLVKEIIKNQRRMKPWEILLLVLGSPLWLSLLVAAAAVVFALYISWWSVIVSLWAVFGTLAGCAFGGLAAGAVFAAAGNGIPGIAMIGLGLVCGGLSVLMFCGCKAATKGTLRLTGKLILNMKSRVVKKGA